MDRFTAFFDSNVLYPAALRNFLMRLTLRGLYRAKWSDMVHEEWETGVTRIPNGSVFRANSHRTGTYNAEGIGELGFVISNGG